VPCEHVENVDTRRRRYRSNEPLPIDPLENAIDRVADATGIPLDPERVAPTADLRAELGIDIFAEGRA